MRFVCKSKIQRARVTDAETGQSGCIAIDEDLLDRVDLYPGERVLVASYASGEEVETYVVGAARGSGVVALGGPAAVRIKPGEEVDIIGFETSNEMSEPLICCVDENNKFTRMLFT